jgi:hypothetical protein
VESSARRSLDLKDTADAHLLLSKALQSDALFAETTKKTVLLKEAEANVRSVLNRNKTPTAEILYALADVLEDEDQQEESSKLFERAFSLSRTDAEVACQGSG